MTRTYFRQSSIKKDLEPGEQIIYIHRHHGIMLSAPLATALGAATVTLGANISTHDRSILRIILILACALVFAQILAVANWFFNFFVLTSKRLILSTRPGTGRAVTIELTRGLEVDLRRSMRGYFLGYGSLSIRSPGGGQYDVAYLKYSEWLYDKLSTHIRSISH